MKKLLLSALMAGIATLTFAQDASYKKGHTFGVHFFMNDFTSAQRIQNNSLGGVLSGKDWAQIKEMSAGLGVSYMKGLTNHLDVATSLSGSFLKYPFPNKATDSNDGFLLELDASLNAKLLPDRFFLVPFLSAGAGLSVYKMSNFAAYVPIGSGLQINFGKQESFLLLQTQYRVGISGSAANHFVYSIGFASPLK